MVPSSEQDFSLRALVGGETPEELFFDPITENDTFHSCLGCLWSLVGSASVGVSLYAADHYSEWGLAESWLSGWGPAMLGGVGGALALVIFTVLQMLSGNEIYVLDFRTDRLELRYVKRRSTRTLVSWPRKDLRRFLLDSPEEEPEGDGRPCLYVMLTSGEKIRLLEGCYPREFVEQVECRLAELCGIPSTTTRE